jgi:hypothetical protein
MNTTNAHNLMLPKYLTKAEGKGRKQSKRTFRKGKSYEKNK